MYTQLCYTRVTHVILTGGTRETCKWHVWFLRVTRVKLASDTWVLITLQLSCTVVRKSNLTLSNLRKKRLKPNALPLMLPSWAICLWIYSWASPCGITLHALNNVSQCWNCLFLCVYLSIFPLQPSKRKKLSSW